MMMMMIQKKMALIFLHRVIVTVIFCSMTSHAMVSRTFELQVNATGSNVCTIDKPSTVVPMAASMMAGRCGMMCNVDPDCEHYQFKEDLAQCDLFDYSPLNFSAIDHCTSYAAPPGIFLFNEFQYDFTTGVNSPTMQSVYCVSLQLNELEQSCMSSILIYKTSNKTLIKLHRKMR